MLQRIDNVRLAAIARARRAWEIRRRLLYPDANRKLKAIALAEQRVLAGETPPVKPRREIRQASPVYEARIERFQQAHSRSPWRLWR